MSAAGRAYGRSRPLRGWAPALHDYRGQVVGLYDGALLLSNAAQIQVGDHVLLGPRHQVRRYRVRHVAYSPGRLSYWRVQLERLAGVERVPLTVTE